MIGVKFVRRLLPALLGLLIAAFLAMPGFAQALPSPNENTMVHDFANVLDAQARQVIDHFGRQFFADTQIPVMMVTVDFTGGEDIQQYATRLLNEWGVGDAAQNNGMVILFSIGDDNYTTVIGTGLEAALPVGEIARMQDIYLEPAFAAQNYSAAAISFYGAMITHLGGTWPDAASPGAGTLAHEFVMNDEGILSQAAVDQINERNRAQYQINQTGVYFVVESQITELLDIYANWIFDQYNLEESSVLVVFSTGDGRFYTVPGRDVGHLLSGAFYDRLESEIIGPPFDAGDFNGAAIAALNAILPLLQAHTPPALVLPDSGVTGNVDPGQGQAASDFQFQGGGGVVFAQTINMIVMFFFIVIIVILISALSRPRRFRGGMGFMPIYRRRWFMPWSWFGPTLFFRHYGRSWHRPPVQPRPPRNGPPPGTPGSFGGGFGSIGNMFDGGSSRGAGSSRSHTPRGFNSGGSFGGFGGGSSGRGGGGRGGFGGGGFGGGGFRGGGGRR